jgi:TonB family protein
MKSLLVLLAIASAAPKPVDVARLVLQKDAAAIVDPLRAALQGNDALSRATAARVIAVRDVKQLVPDVRVALDRESDAVAAREELRALGLLVDPAEIDDAIAKTAKWPASLDNDLAIAIARRGGVEPVDIYFSKLSGLRSISRVDFFRIALWGRPQATTFTASRLVGSRDEPGWSAFLHVMEESSVAVNPAVLAAALNSGSEPIRVSAVWHVVRTYAADPSKLPQVIGDAITKDTDVRSAREEFGRELVRRMSGLEKRDEDRFNDWLQSPEADPLLGHLGDAVYALLTDREYATRHNRCGVMPVGCAMPAKRPGSSRSVPSRMVARAAFQLPGELPAGLADQVARCPGNWLGLLSVTVDSAGRVQSVEAPPNMSFGACLKNVETIIRLSYATNTSVLSPLAMEDVIMSHARGQTLCLDEDSPSNAAPAALMRVGGTVTPPVKIHSVDPQFPARVLQAMPVGASSSVILEAVITKQGCVRSVRPVAQSPFPELNAAAIFAMAQWKFSPGRVDGKPVDVLYNLTVNFKAGR